LKECPFCNQKNNDQERYCSKCGFVFRPSQGFCIQCGKPIKVTAHFCDFCGAKLNKAMNDDRLTQNSEDTKGEVTRIRTGKLPPQTLIMNRYRIQKRVGSGGMGAVYLATDTHLNDRLVALKEISTSYLKSEEEKKEAIDAFKREAHLLSSLNHPNIPRVTDYFSESGKQFLVMDYVEGKTLEELLEYRTNPFSENQVLYWADQLCNVLTYLHNQNPPVIFRDLKPGNVIVSPDLKQIKLIDFGIVRFFKPAAAKDTTKLGTPGYAAPEQYGKGGQSDARTDIYALGAMLHFLLTLRDPSSEPFKFPSVRSLNSNVSEDVDIAIAKATNIEPNSRWQNVKQFYMGLQGLGEKRSDTETGNIPFGRKYKENAKNQGFTDLSFDLELIKPFEKAYEEVLWRARNNFIQQIILNIEYERAIQGKIIILHGDPGVGTTMISEMIAYELNRRKAGVFLIASIDIRLSSDAIRIINDISDRIKLAGKIHSDKTVRNIIEKVYKKAYGKTSLSTNRKWHFGIKLPLEIIISEKFKLGDRFALDFENFKELSNEEKEKISENQIAELEKSLQVFISRLIEKNIQVCLILDKVDNETTIASLSKIMRIPNVIGIIIADTDKVKGWEPNNHADKFMYVPRIWNLPKLILNDMVNCKTEDHYHQIKILTSYLTFMSEGKPKRFVEEFYHFYMPISSSLIKGLLEKKYRPSVQLKKEQIIRVLSYAKVFDCVIDSEGEFLDQEIFVLENGTSIITNASDENRDRYYSAVYSSIREIIEMTGISSYIFSSKVSESLRNNGINHPNQICDQIACNILRKLEKHNMVKKSKRGWYGTGILKRQSEDLKKDK
jgi:serine/threonine protein kinase